MASLSLTLANRRSDIAVLHDAVETFGRAHGLPDDAVFALTLALDEIVTNIVVHGHTDGGAHDIRIDIALNDEAVEATVRDDAPPFNPLTVPPVDLEAPAAGRPVGGLGVHLVRSVMDTVEYRRDGRENVLVVTKRFHTSGSSGPS